MRRVTAAGVLREGRGVAMSPACPPWYASSSFVVRPGLSMKEAHRSFSRSARAVPRLWWLAGVVGGVLSAACTQDFGVFEGDNGFSSGATTTSTTSSTGAGGAGDGGLLTTTSEGGSGGGTTSTNTTSTSTTGTTTTSTTTTTTGSGGGGTGGGGGAPPVENCLNGVDDDGDLASDCADLDCAAYACALKAPNGWQGPVALYDGAAGVAPACPGAFPKQVYEGHDELVPEPAMCSPCECDPPKTSCKLQPLVAGGDLCVGVVASVDQPAPGQCKALPNLGPEAKGFSALPPPPGPAAPCDATGGAAVLPPPKWLKTGLACEGPTSAAGCAAGSVCTAKPAPPFAAKLCVWADGQPPCPEGYPVPHVYSNDAVDARGCTECMCAPGGATQCKAVTVLHEKGGCNGKTLEVPNDASCVKAQAAKSLSVKVEAEAQPCQPSGGTPYGTIQKAPEVTTVCCMP